MALKILVCDDSAFARKQVIRALPETFKQHLVQAANGEEALALIETNQAELTFLDLTMPVMDGYSTLEQIQKRDLNTLVIVISADIQPEAQERVRKMGAMDFIQKPVNSEKIIEVLKRFGLLSEEDNLC